MGKRYNSNRERGGILVIALVMAFVSLVGFFYMSRAIIESARSVRNLRFKIEATRLATALTQWAAQIQTCQCHLNSGLATGASRPSFDQISTRAVHGLQVLRTGCDNTAEVALAVGPVPTSSVGMRIDSISIVDIEVIPGTTEIYSGYFQLELSSTDPSAPMISPVRIKTYIAANGPSSSRSIYWCGEKTMSKGTLCGWNFSGVPIQSNYPEPQDFMSCGWTGDGRPGVDPAVQCGVQNYVRKQIFTAPGQAAWVCVAR